VTTAWARSCNGTWSPRIHSVVSKASAALATIRAPLRLRAEREYPVPALPVPSLTALPPLKELAQFAAEHLFIKHAQAAKSGYCHRGQQPRLQIAPLIQSSRGDRPLRYELGASTLASRRA
jgi:hypothetical protein